MPSRSEVFVVRVARAVEAKGIRQWSGVLLGHTPLTTLLRSVEQDISVRPALMQ